MSRRILYVEDDPTGREVALFNLRRAGYDVTSASDGQEALSRFSLEKFDLVITDIRMPGISGLELVRRIHSMVPCLPVIVVTAFGDMEMAVEAMRGGACYYIAKPFDRAHLQLAVEKILGGRFLADEAEALQIPVSEVERGIVCVFPNRGGSLLLHPGHPAPEAGPSPADEKRGRETTMKGEGT